MSPCHRFILPTLLLLLAWTPDAQATQVRHLDTRELTRSSNDIVIGRVENTRSRWNERRTKILTDVTVRVDRTLKGDGSETVTLTQLGGEVDGVRTKVAGGPLFAAGEEVLLFVWRDPSGRGQVNGLSQGKFEIRRDRATGQQLIQRSMPGLGVRSVRSLAALPSGHAAPRITLNAMIQEIEQALEEAGR